MHVLYNLQIVALRNQNAQIGKMRGTYTYLVRLHNLVQDKHGYNSHSVVVIALLCTEELAL